MQSTQWHPNNPNLVETLNYALTLEHLEATFYREGLAKFSESDFAAAGLPAYIYTRLLQIADHERTHVAFLATALGAGSTKEWSYAFPMSSVAEFLGVASILEGVGVSAYLGAARQILDKDYLTAAGSILTVESRHSAFIRCASSMQDLGPFPSAQDVPLTPNAVYTLASAFITSCPADNPALPVKAYPMLAPAATGPVTPGEGVEFKTASVVLAVKEGSDAKLYAAFITADGPVYADLVEAGDGVNFSVKVPEAGVDGQSYLVLCNCKEVVDDGSIVAGPAVLEVLPASK
jgi:hypothetical protein